MTKTQVLQAMINRTITVQGLARKGEVDIQTIHAWRARGMPCVIVHGDKRPAIRFYTEEAVRWIIDNVKSPLRKTSRKALRGTKRGAKMRSKRGRR